MQQAVDALLAAGLDELVHEFHVGSFESTAVSAALVEDADQVDDYALPGEKRGESCRVVDIRGDQSYRGNRPQVASPGRVACWNGDAPVVARERGCQVRTHESGSAEHADRSSIHRAIIGPSSGPRGLRLPGLRSFAPPEL